MTEQETYDKFFADEEYDLEKCTVVAYSYWSGWNSALKRASRIVRDEVRPHGDWIGDTDLDITCKCSKCRMTFDIDRLKMVMGDYELPPCCPHCGAYMRGKKE